jgi:hypothetical protein
VVATACAAGDALTPIARLIADANAVMRNEFPMSIDLHSRMHRRSVHSALKPARPTGGYPETPAGIRAYSTVARPEEVGLAALSRISDRGRRSYWQAFFSD